MTTVKNLIEKPSFFIISRVLMKFYFVTNIFDRHTFDNDTTTPLKFYEICTERNIITSILTIHLKCGVVHYANLNSSSKNKPNLPAVEYAISFSSIPYICLF